VGTGTGGGRGGREKPMIERGPGHTKALGRDIKVLTRNKERFRVKGERGTEAPGNRRNGKNNGRRNAVNFFEPRVSELRGLKERKKKIDKKKGRKTGTRKRPRRHERSGSTSREFYINCVPGQSELAT